MKKYMLDEQTVKNILEFLNRTDYKGLSEAIALNEIISALQNPLLDEMAVTSSPAQ